MGIAAIAWLDASTETAPEEGIMSEKYNGWTNYETWLISLDCDGNYNRYTYHRVQDIITDLRDEYTDERALTGQLAQALEDMYDERDHECSVITDLITGALSVVNWRELAAAQLTD